MDKECLEFREEIKANFTRLETLGIHNTNNNFMYIDEYGIVYDIENDIVKLVSLDIDLLGNDFIELEVPDFIDEVADNFGFYFKYNWKNRLKSIKFGDSLKVIGKNSFEGCINLEYVCAHGVTKVGSSAFGRCYRLKTVEMENLKIVNSHGFEDCYALENISIPNIEKLAPYSFSNCMNIKLLELNKVLYLERYALFNCQLEKLSLNKNLIYMDYDALKGVNSNNVYMV